MNIASCTSNKTRLVVDPSLDVIETAAIVHGSKKNGAIEIGGGTPKNFYLDSANAMAMHENSQRRP